MKSKILEKNAKLAVNSKEVIDWPNRIWKLWNKHILPKFSEEEYCSSANYFSPRPYKNKYDKGWEHEGFIYTVQPGNKVCFIYLRP